MFQDVDPQIYKTFYDFWFFANLLIKLVLVTVFGGSAGIKRWKLPIITVLMYILAYLLGGVIVFFETGFKSFDINNNMRAFIFFPLALLILSKLFKFKTLDMCDFFAPWIAFRNGLGKIACVICGCCYGYPCDFGFYNRITDSTLFPIQLVEVIFSLLLFVMLLLIKKSGRLRRGEVYPVMLILFGTFRFYLEFGKPSVKLFLGLGALSFHSLFMVLVGAIWLYALNSYVKEKAVRTGVRAKHKRKRKK